MATVAIVLAGGSGSRVQRDVNKVFLPLGDREMLAYSLDTMDRSPLVDEVILVVRDEDRPLAERLVTEAGLTKLVAVVTGGESRHQSEWNAIASVADEIDGGRVDIVVIHDGARPFMTAEILAATIAAARRSGGGVPGLAIEGPIYERRGESVLVAPHGKLRRMQTPQAFQAAPLLAAYRAAEADNSEGVDTAATASRHSDMCVEVVPGDPRNIKVTYVEDIFRAEEYAATFSRGAWAG